jgi:putative heme-binding domain-containing protein
MNRRTQAVVLALLAWGLAPGAGGAAEPWADSSLPASDGLVLWLDAARQEEARKAYGLPPPVPGAALGVWYDGSGQRLHLVQRVAEAQPRFVRKGRHAAVRFDGKDDHLGLAGLGRTLKAFTLFMVTAPRSNPGGFRALVAANETGKNDYTTGFTCDLTGEPSAALDRLNVEGKGFGGVVNLLEGRSYPLGEFRTVEVVCAVGKGGVRLFVDGRPAGARDRGEGVLRMDQVSLGARFYSNSPRAPFMSGFLDGDVAEVLLYDRALKPAERSAVRAYLARKHKGITAALRAPAEGHPLVTVPDPPPVQMLVPGFTVKQLPVDLPNINNVRYRADGKLVALGYNGNVYLLSDSDGDGLEDKVELFWENKGNLRGPIGMALTPPGYKLGTGVFVASKGKVSLLLDGKGTGKADREVIIARGWKEIPQAVDAIGVALDRDGSVYFGLGTADFSNAYLLGPGGKARYDIKSERGTIQKVSPDFRKRQTVCTGVRFTIGLAFNRRGDLFATDQEGATWLPNGNPFDELLHITRGRHYGFPPRHPKHLPGVIDEPSVFDYGPQHQSTCGLVFNEPVHGGPVFGPKGWQSDALITGESRGKLFRTQLAHTPAGYVARNHLLACLNMLTVDSCVSPKGELVVAVHSGPPDWGTGPTGKGKLYKISYTGRSLAQPVAVWAAGPRELRVAFDRPLDPLHLRDLAAKAVIEYGTYARPGDRFEVLRPPYVVVQRQLATPRYRLPVLGAGLTADRRTLVLSTAPHPAANHYALTLPGLGRPEKSGAKKGELPQYPEVDLGYDLCGVEARWQPRSGKGAVSTWLPHLDPGVARPFTAGSAEHDPFWASLRGPGKLTLRTKLDLWQMLRPAVQPGSTLDHTWPPEKVTLTLRSSVPFTATLAGGKPEASALSGGKHLLRLKVDPKEGEPVPLELALNKGEGALSLEVAFHTNEDERPRALPLRRFLLPWAATKAAKGPAPAPKVPELEGGSWLRGRRIFFGDEAGCAKCHRVRGEGGQIGPDLSNLVHRDYASVLRDIREPSAALNPDYVSHVITLTDGRVLTGVPRSAGPDRVLVGDGSGKEVRVARRKIESMVPSAVSVMPEGTDKVLGPEKMRDLMTFLLTQPLVPAPLERPGAPPPRSLAEVEAVLGKAAAPARPGRKLRVVLAAGPKDHGPGEHDYPLWQRRWFNLLSLAEGVRVELADGWPSPAHFKHADVIVFYSNNPGWTAGRGKELDAFLSRGGGLVYLHWAVEGHKAPEALAERIGLASRAGRTRFRHGPLELTFAEHPITRGFRKLRLVDESYWEMEGDPKTVRVLATGVEEGKPRPLLWARERGKGRVFVSIPGHYTWTFDDPLFRVLLLRGIAWAAREPVDRLTELATVGARVAE